jgi:hypothetical protein
MRRMPGSMDALAEGLDGNGMAALGGSGGVIRLVEGWNGAHTPLRGCGVMLLGPLLH